MDEWSLEEPSLRRSGPSDRPVALSLGASDPDLRIKENYGVKVMGKKSRYRLYIWLMVLSGAILAIRRIGQVFPLNHLGKVPLKNVNHSGEISQILGP